MLVLRKIHRDMRNTGDPGWSYFFTTVAGLIFVLVTGSVILGLSAAVMAWGFWALGIPIAIALIFGTGYGLMKLFGAYE